MTSYDYLEFIGYTKKYVRARYGGIDPLNLWHPDIRIFGDLGVFNDGNDALTLFNSEGQVWFPLQGRNCCLNGMLNNLVIVVKDL